MKPRILVVLSATVLATGCVVKTQTINAKPGQHTRPGLRNLSALARVANRQPTGPGAVELDQKMRVSFNLSASGRKALSRSDFAAAEKDFRQALAAYPRSDEAKTGLAQALEGEGRPDEADSAYTDAFTGTDALDSFSTYPSDIAALARHGLLSEEAGQHQEAAKSYDMARQWLNNKAVVPLKASHDLKGPSALRLRAMLEVVRGVALLNAKEQDGRDRSAEALAAFTQAAALQPNDARVQFYHGYGLQKVGRFAQAQVAFQKAAQLDTGGAVKGAAGESLRAVQAHRR